MIGNDWSGGRKDERSYHQVRKDRMKALREKYDLLKPHLDERGRRLWAASEAVAFGRGGLSAVSEALALSRNMIIDGMKELRNSKAGVARQALSPGRQRRPGGGRKKIVQTNPEIIQAIEAIVSPATRGDPMNPLLWVSKSLANIQQELAHQGFKISRETVRHILTAVLKYGPQGLQKTKEGRQNPDRNQQFENINTICKAFQAEEQPAISVDAKK